jgi:hypothetical protein
MIRYRLGKKAARPDSVLLRFRRYANLSVLPTPPAEFGHDNLVKGPLGMLGNDSYGNCVWAGAAHETMLLNASAGKTVTFTDDAVLSDYSACTGFNKADPSTDNGTDIQQAAAYRQNTGVIDAAGNRHKIGAYLAIAVGDLDAHLTAAYLFDCVGIGVLFPNTAEAQFDANQPWDVVPNMTVEGGHYIPGVARRGGLWVIETWGREQLMTDAFLKGQNDESIAYVSIEMLTGGISLEGFDAEQLNYDLNQIKRAA